MGSLLRDGDVPTGSAHRPAPTRSAWRSVALPSEHGGWGLTLEPALLGLLLAPSLGGATISLAAFALFLFRTPAKFVAVDVRRHRWLQRTSIAMAFVVGEGVIVTALISFAAGRGRSEPGWWLPAVIALPLIAVEAVYDARSRGRRLVPELFGAVAVCATAAMIVRLGGGSASLGAAAWLVLSARALVTIPWVRGQVARLHGRTLNDPPLLYTELGGIVAAGIAVAVRPAIVLGAVCVMAFSLLQRHWANCEPQRAVVIGVRQTLMGLALVGATALSVAILPP